VAITREPAKVRAGLYEAEHDHMRVVWKISHHGFSVFQALFPVVNGTLQLDPAKVEASKLDISVDMGKVMSGIPVFDERLRSPRFFDVAKYPTANFRSTKIVRTGDKTAKITGDLTYLGVTKPVTLDATFRQAGAGLSNPPGYRIGFDAKGQIKRTDFGKVEEVSDTAVGTIVDLEIEAEFMLKE
jgi:polyisoprenoid-binding protein YceI